jgi:beta-mannosidase
MSGIPVPGNGQPAKGVRRELDLSGSWRYLPNNGDQSFASPSLDDSGWPEMRLPSNWFLLGSVQYPLNADRVVPRPGDPGRLTPVDTESGLDWSGTIWYRRKFDWHPAVGTRAIVDLDMVDYYATVFVNGAPAGSHEGYFQKWSVDVTALVHPGENLIALRISAPALPFDLAEHYPISWPRHQNQVKGIFAYHDTRPGATSSRGQERSTGGVIRGLAIRESSGLDLTSVDVTPFDVSEKSARLVIRATIRNWTNLPAPALIKGTIRARNFQSWEEHPITLAFSAAPGVSVHTTELRLANPALWWSWDYGKPNLYQLDAALLLPGESAPVDSATTAFGVRSITRDSEWVWRLNGKRIYPRGTNYISTQWMSQADAHWYARDVDMMIGANLNTARVHAHLERPEFYDAADSAGLMIWQDFPLQWGYTDDPAFREEALRQAADMVDRFRGHPSIIVWSMHNESPHAMSWMEKKNPKQNLALDEALVSLVATLDSSRVDQRDSGTGDGHPYPGWYFGKVADFRKLPPEKFISEYGAQALPDIETLRTMFPPEALWPTEQGHWDQWLFHDFQPDRTFETAKIEKGNSIEDFIAASQLYQAQVTRYGTEIFRRAKWKGNTGIYQFMFVEDWPSVTWAVVDYFRRAKPGYLALRSSMQPVLPSIEYTIDNRDKPIALHIVNDLHRAFPSARLKWRIASPQSRAEPTSSKELDIPEDSAFKVVDLGPLPSVTRGGARLDVWIEDAAGKVLGKSSLAASDFSTVQR